VERVLRFGVLDAARDVRGLVEVAAIDADAARLLVTWWRGDRMLFHAVESVASADGLDGGIAAGPVSLRPGGSGGDWEIRVTSTDLRAELRWRPTASALRWALPTAPAFGHEEQFGTVNGNLVVRGESVALDAVGQREQVRGPALSSVADHALSVRTSVAADQYAYVAIINAGRRDHLFGCLVSDGAMAGLATAEVTVAYAYPGGPPLLGQIDVCDVRGRTLRHSFARGAMFSTVDAAPGGALSRHVVFPVVTGSDGVGTGRIDHWYTDAALVSTHLFATASAEGRP
jgi:hypothetical protein